MFYFSSFVRRTFIVSLFIGNVYWAFLLGDLFYRLGL